MKVVLGLALLCCFIGGISSGGCGCKDGVKKCYCKVTTKHVIKAKVLGAGVSISSGKVKYEIKTLANYKKKHNFKFVIVPDVCRKDLDQNKGNYILMGKKVAAKTLKTPGPNGLIKLKDNLSSDQIQFLKNPVC